ncbi:odorant receptor 85f [Drosophila tropicalis]|uniref:odorant receptor 85f n=1 Tax=Drosophila tropicalis TaxID=46794 RepID=UPI0035ABB429
METVQYSYEDFTRIPAQVHRLMGYNILDLPRRAWVKWLMLLYRFLCIFSHIICVIFMIYRIYERTSINTIQLLMRYGTLVTYVIHSDTKFATSQQKQAIKRLSRNLSELYPKNTVERFNYRVNDFYWSRPLIVMISTYIISSAMVVIGPMLQSAFLYFYNDKKHFLYLHCYEYFIIDPKDERAVYHYVCAYILEWLHSTHMVISNVATDLWLVCFQVQICMHFKYIGQTLAEYQPHWQNDVQDRKFLAKMIKKHSYLIVLQNDLNSIFGGSLLLSLLSTAGVLCTVGLYIRMGGLNLESVSYIMFMTTSSMQLYLVCYYGDLINVLVTSILGGIYTHSWYEASIAYKKYLLIIIVRAQQSVELSAMGYLTVSLDTFKQVMTVTYRVFALIREMIQ